MLASVDSPPMERIVKLMNKPSDNFFAELLAKDIAMQVNGRGTTSAGAALVAGFARRLGARARSSSTAPGCRAATGRRPTASSACSPRWRGATSTSALLDSLPIAGRDGTLYDRMRRGPARSHCRAKTGTLSDVSALSGYCEARSGDVYGFSILMNAINPTSARACRTEWRRRSPRTR